MENSKKPETNSTTIVAYGEALWDLLPSGPVLGGAPLNFAYRVNSLGYRGIMISQLGNDAFGDQALKQMIALGMETDFIQRTSDYPTGTVEVSLDENKNPDYFIVPGVAYDYIQHTDELDELIANANCLCFGSLIQRTDVSRKTLGKVLDRFSGKYALYDINLRKNCYTVEIVKSSMEQSNILKLNDGEMVTVAQMYGLPDSSFPEFVDGLFQKTPLKYCVVTLGGRGAFAASNDGEKVYEPAYKVTLIDSCGSGDAFTAGFLHNLLKKKGLREACKIGNAMGAMVAEQHGATQVIRYEEIERFMQERETIDVESQFKEGEV